MANKSKVPEVWEEAVVGLPATTRKEKIVRHPTGVTPQERQPRQAKTVVVEAVALGEGIEAVVTGWIEVLAILISKKWQN